MDEEKLGKESSQMSDESFRIGLAQMDTSDDWQENRKKMAEFIRQGVDRGARLMIFPETAEYIGEDFRGHSTQIPGEVTDFFGEEAAKYGIYLHCGSLTERRDQEKMRNTSLLFNPQGRIVAQYSKLHLFDVELEDGPSYQESEEIAGGQEIVVADTPLCKMGFSICYDLRFPELFRLMARQGAQLLINCADFTANTGKDHWEPLLRARAIENTCYVAAVGQCGRKPKFRAWGHSMLIDPWGKVVASLGDEPGLLVEEVDLSRVEEVRRQIPSLNNDREDIYQLQSARVHVCKENIHGC